MKRLIQILFFTTIFCLQMQVLKSQVLFHEDFETSPVTSILNNGGETQLPEGPSPCGFASRGNTSNFNSMNVDFQNSQNSTYFLGVNPQTPCGGYYMASLKTGTLNLTADSLVFKCRYFISNTLLWGAPTLQVNIHNGLSNYVIWSQFSTIGSWDSLTIGIPATQIGATDTMLIVIGGGEGVAIDDITILNIPYLHVAENNNSDQIKIFPNPAQNILTIENISFNAVLSIYDINGKMIVREKNVNNTININQLEPGLYCLKATDGKGFYTQRFVKE
jgi:hypothetical protein